MKEKIAERELRRRNGDDTDPLIYHHKKIADMLAMIPDECESVARRIAANDEDESDVSLKEFEDNYLSETEKKNTLTPIVLSLLPLRENKETIQELDTENSCDESQKSNTTSLEFPTMPSFNNLINTKPKKKRRHRNETEDENLNDLVEVEKEKTRTFNEIAAALTTSNEIENKRLKVEEQRNRLISERNAIESERNELFKSLLEHLVSKGSY